MKVGNTAYIVESNRYVREVEIRRCSGGMFLVRFTDSGGGIQVKAHRLFATREEAVSDGIVPDGGNMTVLELVKRYVSQKRGVRHNTEANYKFVINIIAKEPFGQKRIDKVKLSDAKAWLIKLQDDGRGYSSIHTVRGVVRPAFQMALDDDLIRRNPFEFQLSTVVVNDSVTREAITRKQERKFLDFIKNDKHFCRYYDGIYILFHNGLRISEFVGLTVSDIDFENRRINVDHQLQRKRNMEYIIEETKTDAGVRQIPMTDDVYDCFQRIIANRNKPKVEPMIDGKIGFLYLDKKRMRCQWWHFIGKSTFSILEKSITVFTKYRCLLLRHMYAGTRSVQIWKKVHESKDTSIYYGTFGYQRNTEYLHSC